MAQTIEHIEKKRKDKENSPQSEIGSSPGAIASNYQTNKIHVANSGEGTVSVLDDNSGNIANKIRVGTTPSSIAEQIMGTNNIRIANKLKAFRSACK